MVCLNEMADGRGVGRERGAPLHSICYSCHRPIFLTLLGSLHYIITCILAEKDSSLHRGAYTSSDFQRGDILPSKALGCRTCAPTNLEPVQRKSAFSLCVFAHEPMTVRSPPPFSLS